jgi:membrane-associated phospholipid phosphatase
LNRTLVPTLKLWILIGFVLCRCSTVCVVTAADDFPYDIESGRETAVWVTGGLSLGTGLVLEAGVDPLTVEQIEALNPDDIPALDRGATRQWSPGADLASDILVYSLLAVPVLLVVDGPGADQPKTVASMYGQTVLLSNGLALLLKNAVQRARPYVYDDDPRVPQHMRESKEACRSFPSQHSSNAFTAAVFLSSVYTRLNPESSARGWVWGGSLTAASVTGYLRYRAGKHFLTDIVAGALLGATVGYLVPHLYEVESEGQDVSKSWNLLQIGWLRRF